MIAKLLRPRELLKSLWRSLVSWSCLSPHESTDWRRTLGKFFLNLLFGYMAWEYWKALDELPED